MTINPNSNCSRCGKKSLLTDEVTGEQFCGKCGYVISEKVDESGPERRSFSTQGGVDTTRTGAPSSLTIHDMDYRQLSIVKTETQLESHYLLQ